MKYLYDADATIDYFQNFPNARSTFQSLLPDGIAISGITLIELYTGILDDPSPKQAEQELKTLLAVMTTVRLNQRVIHETARLRHDLLTRGLSIRRRAYDLINAATALAHDLTLVTSNTDDFKAIIGLRQLDPRTGQLVTH